MCWAWGHRQVRALRHRDAPGGDAVRGDHLAIPARLIAEATSEIERGRLAHLIEYGLCQAQAKEYVRAIQERLLVVPLLIRLLNTSQGHANLEARLLWLLDDLRGLPQTSQGYGPANLVALLRVLRGNLRGLDLSRLALRGMWLQGVQMQDATLSGAVLQGCVFTEPFDAIAVVTTSKSGQYGAAGSRRGEVWVWTQAGQILHQAWQAHIDTVRALAWSPDAKLLVSGCSDGSIWVWQPEMPEPDTHVRRLSGHTQWVRGLAFAPDGTQLASGSWDQTIKLWDPATGECLQVLQDPDAADPIFQGVAWSPDGRLLACGDDGAIMLWDLESGEPLLTLRRDRPYERLDISGVKGLTQAQKASLRALGAIESVPVPDIQEAP